jgi:hypothetical protein
MNGANMGTYLEMLRVITFVMDTENFGLKIWLKFENNNWNLNSFSNSDCYGDPETIISVAGLIACLMALHV